MLTPPAKHFTLYVLKLEQGKYYVGITSKSPEERMREHINGFMGARWTKKYKPLSIFYTQDLGQVTKEKAELYESRVTREYLRKYGDQNVRGGDLTFDTKIVRRFGLIFDEDGWEVAATMILLMLIIIYFALDKYIW